MNGAKLRALPCLVLLFPLDCLVAIVLLLADLVGLPARAFGFGPHPPPRPDRTSVTIQILNWDGKHLLAECLPRVLEAADGHAVIVVDNGSTDGSVEFVRTMFPGVRVLELDRNYGFSIGNNRGFSQVETDIVVLLNNDMLVDPDFLPPLLEPFADRDVFAVTSQISFADQTRRQEETGNTHMVFERGFFRMWHADVRESETDGHPVPVAWAGGGSCAIDRRKLAQIGGLDPLYHPFYVEDADMSYQAWKRGWKCLLAPGSHVVHRHRGTSRPKFGDLFVDSTIRRNQFLFVWKNLTDFGMLAEHLLQLPRIHGRSILERGPGFEIRAYSRAVMRLPFAALRRAGSVGNYVVSDRALKLSQ